MLTQLAIHRIGVIDEAVLDFGPGFTALTGETGAGKTMVVTGLGLLMGRRLDSRRAGLASMVEGRVEVESSTALASRLDELGAETDDDEVLIVRKVTKDGRSRAHVGGVPVPVSTLASVIGADITIHGQSDQMRLKDQDQQREALDSVLADDAREAIAAHGRIFAESNELRKEAQQLGDRLHDRDARSAELTAILERIDQAGTFPGEDDELRQEIAVLTSAGEEVEQLDAALMHLVGDEYASVLAAVERAADAVSKIGSGASQGSGSVNERVSALREEVSDIAREVSLRRDDSLASPGRLAEAQERLHDLTTLTRDIGPRLGGAASIDELLDRSKRALKALEELEGGAQRLEELNERLGEVENELAQSASSIRAARKAAAGALGQAIEGELAGLEMPGAEVRIALTDSPLGATGTDAVQFELRPHPGADFMPLATGASGGELSRVMLALEVAVARLGKLSHGGMTPVFIFDEIDAGIGGRAARAVGERLAQLAQSAQVIVVTHLPQVAAFAETHLNILKSVTDDGATTSTVVPLDGEARVAELARMLAGDADSRTALEHARELLDASAGPGGGEA